MREREEARPSGLRKIEDDDLENMDDSAPLVSQSLESLREGYSWISAHTGRAPRMAGRTGRRISVHFAHSGAFQVQSCAGHAWGSSPARSKALHHVPWRCVRRVAQDALS